MGGFGWRHCGSGRKMNWKLCGFFGSVAVLLVWNSANHTLLFVPPCLCVTMSVKSYMPMYLNNMPRSPSLSSLARDRSTWPNWRNSMILGSLMFPPYHPAFGLTPVAWCILSAFLNDISRNSYVQYASSIRFVVRIYRFSFIRVHLKRSSMPFYSVLYAVVLDVALPGRSSASFTAADAYSLVLLGWIIAGAWPNMDLVKFMVLIIASRISPFHCNGTTRF